MVLQFFQSKSIFLDNHQKMDLLSKYLNLHVMEVDRAKIDCNQPDQEPEMQFETCNAKQWPQDRNPLWASIFKLEAAPLPRNKMVKTLFLL